VQVRYDYSTIGNWVKYRTFRHITVLIGNSTVRNRTMLGESTVQDRAVRGNKLRCRETKKVNHNFMRKKGTRVEFGDGPSGWSRWTGQSKVPRSHSGASRNQDGVTVQGDRTRFSTVLGKDHTPPYKYGTVRWYGTVEISQVRRNVTSLFRIDASWHT